MKPEECALLIVDMQGKLANLVYESEVMLANTIKLIKSCQALEIPTLLLEQNPQGLGATAPEIRQCLEDTQSLEKHTFNALAEDHIKRRIMGMNKKHWLVVGIEAHICIFQSVQGLLLEGCQVQLVSDCISSRIKSNRDLAIDNMRHLGARITSLEMCIYQLMGSSKNPKFREILSIIK